MSRYHPSAPPSSRTLRIIADQARATDLVRGAFKADAPIAITSRMLKKLATELGDNGKVMDFLHRLVMRYQKPCAVNARTPDGSSTTFMIAPPLWTQDKLAGWVGGIHQELEDAFGPIGSMRTQVEWR
jgi:hypothetical protein